MRNLALAAVAAALLAVPSAGAAQLQLAGRFGYSIAAGEFARRVPVPRTIDGYVPLQLDLTYRLGQGLSVGAFAAYGIANLASAMVSACETTGTSCGGRQLRAGLQVMWTLEQVSPVFAPWFALAGGGDWLMLRWEEDGSFTKDRWSGLAGSLTFGVDLKGRNPTFGPYLSVGLGRYDRYRRDVDGDVYSADIAGDRTLHREFSIGLRGAFQL